jgi:tetratricopeptide (TPR) repeat protein
MNKSLLMAIACMIGLSATRAAMADDDFPEVTGLTPQAEKLVNEASILSLQANGIDQAIANYNEAIKLCPKSSGLYHYASFMYAIRGRTHLGAKRYPQAMADLNEAIVLDPKNVGALFARGRVLSEQKQYDKALVDLNEVLVKDKLATAVTSEFIAKMQMEQGKYDDAIQTCQRANAIQPWAPLYYAMAESHMKLRDYKAAESDCHAALKKDRAFGKANELLEEISHYTAVSAPTGK